MFFVQLKGSVSPWNHIKWLGLSKLKIAITSGLIKGQSNIYLHLKTICLNINKGIFIGDLGEKHG